MKIPRAIAMILILLIAGANTSEHLSTDAVKNIMQDIDQRVSWINECRDNKWYEDQYEGDIMIYRCLTQDLFDPEYPADEKSASYYMYYDAGGKLIYVHIIHYRAANYAIYFHNDELLHVDVEVGLFIDGDISEVQVVITKDPSYAFVLEDLAFCLSHAYQ